MHNHVIHMGPSECRRLQLTNARTGSRQVIQPEGTNASGVKYLSNRKPRALGAS